MASALDPWDGCVPTSTDRGDGAYVIAAIQPGGFRTHGVVSVPIGASYGVWDRETGKRLVGVLGTELIELVPDRAEVALVRTVLRADAQRGGTSRADFGWVWERYALPGGERVASCELDRKYSSRGWLVSITYAKKDRGTIARIACRDEDRAYSFYIALAADGRDREA